MIVRCDCGKEITFMNSFDCACGSLVCGECAINHAPHGDIERTTPSIVLNPVKVKTAYGLYIALDDCGFDDLHNLDAEHKADIVINHNGVVKEFELFRFLELLGFKVSQQSSTSDP